MLGQIEREESSPTIAKLWQIASGLRDFFFGVSLVRSRKKELPSTFLMTLNMKVNSIFPYSKAVNFENT